MNTNTIHCGDCLDVMRGWPDACIDAVVTDPPYGLSFMGKKWDYDVPGVELWREVYRVLKDGGRLLAFSGARTQHRMVCRIEDAGFVIEDCMMWLYGSGFPKHKSKLKPAYEPICVARKGSVSELNIDAGRIGVEERTYKTGRWPANVGSGPHRIKLDNHGPGDTGIGMMDGSGRDRTTTVTGRWPANVCMDEAAALALDQQSGVSVSVPRTPSRTHHTGGVTDFERGSETSLHSDSGGASRFFYCAKASRSERNEGCGELPERQGVGVGALRDSGERDNLPRANVHPTVKPVDLMRWLIRLTTFDGQLILDPFFGSGTTGVAANLEGRQWIGIERDPDYCAIARARTAQQGIFASGASADAG